MLASASAETWRAITVTPGVRHRARLASMRPRLQEDTRLAGRARMEPRSVAVGAIEHSRRRLVECDRAVAVAHPSLQRRGGIPVAR